MGSSAPLRRVTTTFSKFLRPKPSAAAIFIFPSSTRFLSSSSSTTTAETSSSSSTKKRGDGDNPPVIVGIPIEELRMDHPLQYGGPGAVEVNSVKDGTLVRVAVPGVSPNGLKMWVKDHTVFFAAKGESEHEDDEMGRCYGGSFEFSPEFNRAKDAKGEIKDGILRLLVPTVDASPQEKVKN